MRVVQRVVSLFFVLLLPAGGTVCARQMPPEQPDTPPQPSLASLPDLGMTSDTAARTRHLAEMARAFGEASMQDNGLDSGEQAKRFALETIRDVLNQQVNQQLEEWLSPWGNASVALQVDSQGHWTGSHGNWFVPLEDNARYLSWGQAGFSRQDEGLVASAGLGQRWIAGRWLLGYSTFYDTMPDEQQQRAGVGAEAWGAYLRLSANYYHPFDHWSDDSLLQMRMARGYDVTAQARLPFYQHLNTSLSVEQYFGDNVDLFHSGQGDHNPVAVALGLSYTPVPLVTVSAQHKQGESGVSQNNLGLKLNYRFGVPLKKQLQASEVAVTRSLRGSRYDSPERNTWPVMEYRQRKSLSVFLATPPWDLTPGETVMLKLQIRSRAGISSLSWQGDTQALSLTPPVDQRSTDGWTIIMPAWDYQQGASNQWRLSVVAEDEKGQRVVSNTITLSLTEPLVTFAPDDGRGSLTP